MRQPGVLPLLETLTKDLSSGGVCCLSPIPLPVFTEVRLQISLGTGEEPLEVRGKAVWLRTIPHSDQFDIGIAFLDLHPLTKRRLSVCLERLSNQLSSSSV